MVVVIAIVAVLVLVATVDLGGLVSGEVSELWDFEDWSFVVVVCNPSVVVVFLVSKKVLEENTFSVTNVFVVGA